ncbi:MAG: DUF1643 domain-containing protein [Saccharospirillaceae bacterium]|nr:DUF1643 domain-containing protein [Saccharospirillaceae bacterium]
MKYRCYGHFYPLREPSFRDVLLISDVENIKDNFAVDLLVVMMNPGSSEPLNTNDKVTVFSKECVLTKPDNTQSQVMIIMKDNGFRTAVVINLSDVREPKSSRFSRKLKGLSFGSVGEKHSLFSEQRNEELSGIIDKCGSCPVIFASGVNYKLRFLTSQAISKFENNRIIGDKNMKGLFYHPLPRSKQKQEAWVDEINRQIYHRAN